MEFASTESHDVICEGAAVVTTPGDDVFDEEVAPGDDVAEGAVGATVEMVLAAEREAAARSEGDARYEKRCH